MNRLDRVTMAGRIPALLLTLLAGVVPAASLQASPASAQALETVQLPAVTVVTAQRQEVIQRIPVAGTLVPRNEALVYPEVSGATIDKLMVDVGDSVAKGDVLAVINDRSLRAQLAQAEAEYARAEAGIRQARSQISSAEASSTQAQSTLERTQQLRDSGTATQASLDSAVAAGQTATATLDSARDGLAVAEAQLQQARAGRDIAQLNVSHATITAPVDGLVSARNGQIGAIAASGGEPIFRIIESGLIEVEAEVVETSLGQIMRGDPVQLDIASLGRIEGEVRRISPIVDPLNRLGTVRIALDPVPGLRTGLFAGGWIIADRHDGVTVPSTAVLTDGDGSYVLRVEDGVLERRAVTAGLIWQDAREILKGIEAGDTVVARAGAFFGDGDSIDPVPAEPEATAAADPAAQTTAKAEAAATEVSR